MQKFHHTNCIHKISSQYKFLYDEEEYRIVQWLHYINCTHRVSVLEFPLLGIDSMTKATLVKGKYNAEEGAESSAP